MIRHMTFCHTAEEAYIAPKFGAAPDKINHWLFIQKILAESGDLLVWVVTRKQMPDFMAKIKKYDLEKYLILKQDKYTPLVYNRNTDRYDHPAPDAEGITNHNYPTDPRKLKLFIMKGAK